MSLLDLPSVPLSLACMPGRLHRIADDVQDKDMHRCESEFERKRQNDRDRALRSYYRNRERTLARQKQKRATESPKQREARLARVRAAKARRRAQCA